MQQPPQNQRRTKIVCTLGPAVDEPDALRALVEAGMDVARFNFSHGTHDEHQARFNTLQQIAGPSGRCLAVLQDLCGPKIRVGNVAPGTRLHQDARFVLTTRDVPGDENAVQLPIPEIVASWMFPLTNEKRPSVTQPRSVCFSG